MSMRHDKAFIASLDADLRAQISLDQDLSSHNTLGLKSQAKIFCCLSKPEHLLPLLDAAKQYHIPVVMLGTGSNVRLKPEIDALVLQLAFKGIHVFKQTPNHVFLDVACGENWHDLVVWSLAQSYFGLENLALIPGTVGAAPVQNIGAYGVELSDRLDSIEVFDRPNSAYRRLDKAQCEFAYRDSIFKRGFAADGESQLLICNVRLKLSLQDTSDVSYPALQALLLKPTSKSVSKPDSTYKAQAVFDAVVKLRESKLPSPAVLANAGSFFKNPVVDSSTYDVLKSQFEALPAYPQTGGRYKLAAAWLLEQAGAKQANYKALAVHQQQALVLVNHSATGSLDFADLSVFTEQLQTLVKDKFGIDLEPEPVVIG